MRFNSASTSFSFFASNVTVAPKNLSGVSPFRLGTFNTYIIKWRELLPWKTIVEAITVRCATLRHPNYDHKIHQLTWFVVLIEHIIYPCNWFNLQYSEIRICPKPQKKFNPILSANNKVHSVDLCCVGRKLYLSKRCLLKLFESINSINLIAKACPTNSLLRVLKVHAEMISHSIHLFYGHNEFGCIKGCSKLCIIYKPVTKWVIVSEKLSDAVTVFVHLGLDIVQSNFHIVAISTNLQNFF